MPCKCRTTRTIVPTTETVGAATVVTTYSGKECVACGSRRGPLARPDKQTWRTKQEYTLPEWLARRVDDGEWTPRMPAAREFRDQVLEVAKQGGIHVDLKWHPKACELVLSHIQAIKATPSALVSLRTKLGTTCPDAADWIARATQEQLTIAEHIIQIPRYKELAWPPKVWAAKIFGYSKARDITGVVQALGATVTRRPSANVVWFYGEGTITTPYEKIALSGETPIAEERLQAPAIIETPDAMVVAVENRDVAFACPGLSIGIDGHPTATQKAILQCAARDNQVAVWTDMDVAGVRMVRAVRKKIPDAHVWGFAKWPVEWACTKTKAGAREDAITAKRAGDEFDEILDWIRDTGWFEQERIFVEASLAGVSVAALRPP